MIGLEGLRGHGKTYDSVRSFVIPALSEGRKLFTNIRGLQADNIANYINEQNKDVEDYQPKTSEEIQSLIHEQSEAEILSFPTAVLHSPNDQYKNILWIIDEFQNPYPASRDQLNDDTRELFTRSRHYGVDMVIISQNFQNIHSFARRMIEQKNRYVNRSAVGKPDSAKITTYAKDPEDQKGEKYIEVTTSIMKYLPEVYNCYKSTEAGVTTASTLKDSRANVFNKKSLKYGVPIIIILCLGAVGYLVSLFTSDDPLGVTAGIKEKEAAQIIQPNGKPLTNTLTQADVDAIKQKKQREFNPILEKLENSQPIYYGTIKTKGSVKYLINFRHQSELIQIDQNEFRSLGLHIKTVSKNLIQIHDDSKSTNIYIFKTGLTNASQTDNS